MSTLALERMRGWERNSSNPSLILYDVGGGREKLCCFNCTAFGWSCTSPVIVCSLIKGLTLKQDYSADASKQGLSNTSKFFQSNLEESKFE